MFFNLDFKRGTAILKSFDVIAESEDDKGIPSSILPVTNDLVFFDIPFQNIESR